MEKYLKIGIISKPQGVKGEVKVNPLTDDVYRFNKLKSVYIDGTLIKVERVRTTQNQAYLTLFGVNDRNSAELLRGKFLLVERSEAITPKQNSYFISDIIGCAIFIEDNKIGEVIEVTCAKTDYWTIKDNNGKIARFPFLKDLIVSIDIEDNKIVLSKKRFNEVVCYEN